MKKIGLLLIGLIFLLVACSEDDMTYEAKASDFEGGGFNRNSQMIVVIGEELIISGEYNSEGKLKTTIDKILESENEVLGVKYYEKTYKNVKIKIKKDKYYITADNGISLEFQKIGDRIIVDEEGAEFYTMLYP